MAENPDNTIIDLKDAVTAARQYFSTLFPNSGFINIQLEEVELSEDGSTWKITLGYDPTNRESYPAIAAPIGRPVREYKAFEIDAHNGLVKSMKIRKV